MRRFRVFATAPALVLAAGGCFATRGDVRTLQGDLATVRADAARADSMHRGQLQAVARQVGVIADSVRSTHTLLARFAADVSRFQGDLATTLHTFGQQLIAVQEQTGQSQRRLQEFRADLEAKSNELSASAGAPGGPQAARGAAPAAPATGPLQLFQLAQEQLKGFRYAAARAGFEEFLAQYPSHEYAGSAQFFLGECYAAEGNTNAADAAFARVVDKYPASEKAPNALYKRAALFLKSGQRDKARSVYQQIVDKYPGTPEAELAADAIKTLK